MYLRILDLPKIFRPGTSHVYPPFKNGRYLEEFAYHYLSDRRAEIATKRVFIPVYWTHMQNHPAFERMKGNYQLILNRAIQMMPPDTEYFTVVQHDDGAQLELPPGTMIFGSCTGSIPLPLIYEDVNRRLLQTPRLPTKSVLASFVGTAATHPMREELVTLLASRKESHHDVEYHVRKSWSPVVGDQDSTLFIESTLRARFCLAPRGYGRSSFRFFEAMELDTVPVYIWDDIEWLPYKDQVDYSSFSVSIRREELPRIWDILAGISDETYEKMIETMRNMRRYFTLDGMCEYVIDRIVNDGKCF